MRELDMMMKGRALHASPIAVAIEDLTVLRRITDTTEALQHVRRTISALQLYLSLCRWMTGFSLFSNVMAIRLLEGQPPSSPSLPSLPVNQLS
jgi:hypothetical protein